MSQNTVKLENYQTITWKYRYIAKNTIIKYHENVKKNSVCVFVYLCACVCLPVWVCGIVCVSVHALGVQMLSFLVARGQKRLLQLQLCLLLNQTHQSAFCSACCTSSASVLTTSGKWFSATGTVFCQVTGIWWDLEYFPLVSATRTN